MRSNFDQAQRTFKRAAEAAYALAGGVSLIARFVRVSKSQLTKYASDADEHEDVIIPIDVAVAVDRLAKSPVILTEIARMEGYGLRLLDPDELSHGELEALSEDDVLAVMDEATDLWRLARVAYADGRIDALERRDLQRKLRRLIRAAECVLNRLGDV